MKLEHNWPLLAIQFDERYLRVIHLFHIDQLVLRDAPIGRRSVQWPFEGHLTVDGPHLEQVGHIIVLLQDVIVDNFHNYGAKLGVFFVEAAEEHFVEFVERNFVQNFADIFLG